MITSQLNKVTSAFRQTPLVIVQVQDGLDFSRGKIT